MFNKHSVKGIIQEIIEQIRLERSIGTLHSGDRYFPLVSTGKAGRNAGKHPAVFESSRASWKDKDKAKVDSYDETPVRIQVLLSTPDKLIANRKLKDGVRLKLSMTSESYSNHWV